MNAIDIKPAVINAIGRPRKLFGMPVLFSMRSRIPAIKEIANKNPSEDPSALVKDCISV